LKAYDIVEKRFIKPFKTRTLGNVGVELEFPLVNLDKDRVDKSFVIGLLEFFAEKGFEVEETTKGSAPAFIYNEDGDYLSFDNSYNNFEFAMNYGPDLCDIAERFYSLLRQAQEYLKQGNHILTGMGTHPYKQYICQDHVDFPVYNMVDEFLHTYPAKHSYPDFPSYLSSVQTHLDLDLKSLPRAATLFARMDFVRAALFSNSPSWESSKILCFRDFLWEESAFPNTGKVDEVYNSTDDIIQSFLKRKMFNRIRNGKYEIFEPVVLKEYFENEKYEALPSDIEQFLSFRNIEITSRGTLEVRSDCSQPICDAFAPPAFSLGILYNLDKAEKTMSGIFPDITTTKLRNTVICGEELDFPKGFLEQIIEIAEEGLKMRGKGEEKFIKPLYHRANTKTNPAKDTLARLEKGGKIESIILEYSRF
jgi:gamma-glutamylcysteine synthetase